MRTDIRIRKSSVLDLHRTCMYVSCSFLSSKTRVIAKESFSQPLALQIFFQVTTATKALERLGGMEVPTFGFDAASFHDLYKQIEQALECFEKAKPEAFVGKEDMPVTIDVPNMWHFDLNGLTYLQEFVLPNL